MGESLGAFDDLDSSLQGEDVGVDFIFLFLVAQKLLFELVFSGNEKVSFRPKWY